MKLVGWMHRKFRQNSGQPFKDFAIGQQASDEQQYFPRRSINNPFKEAQRGPDNDGARSDEDYEDESLISMSDIFPGFLAIGTLGSSDPATPKFSISIDHITQTQTEVTHNELKLINDELEKMLEVDPKDDGGLRRDGHVSKVLEGRTESNYAVSGDAMVCPLQEYLFGSAVEMSETTTMAKKENRTSLGELFQKSKVLEEVGGGRCEKDEVKQVEKEGDKYGMQLIKKKLKKKMFSAAFSKSSLSSTASGEVLDASNATKLHKILHLFNRKVYPAESITMAKDQKKGQKAQKNDKKKKTRSCIDGSRSVNKNSEERATSRDEDIMMFPKKVILKQTLQHYNTQSVPPQFSDISDDDDDDSSNWNKEQWIKSDSDCK